MGCGSSRQPAEPAAAPTRDLSRRSEVVAPDVDVSIVRELTSRIANLQEQNLHDARGRRGSFDEQPQRQQRIRTASLDELPASEAAAALDALAA